MNPSSLSDNDPDKKAKMLDVEFVLMMTGDSFY